MDSGSQASSCMWQAACSTKAPYNQYGSLQSEGVEVVWGDPAEPSTYPHGPFDIVYDNNGKKLDVCKPLIDAFKVRAFGALKDCNLNSQVVYWRGRQNGSIFFHFNFRTRWLIMCL